VIIIKKNYLNKIDFDKIKSKIMAFDFPWFFEPKMTNKGWGRENPFFFHCFYDNFLPNSHHFQLFENCLKDLKVKSLIKIRANLNLNFKEPYYSNWHVDQEIPCKTALLYLNTNNGYTEIKDGEKILKINCEENTMVMFDSHHLHRLVSQTDEQRRIAINFNFIL
jgi:hypothetical protein